MSREYYGFLQRNAKDDQPNPFKLEFKDAQAFIRALGGHMVTNLRAKFSFAQSQVLFISLS